MKLRTHTGFLYLPFFLGLLLSPGACMAQSQAPPMSGESFYKRFSFGVRAGYMFTELVKTQTLREAVSTVDPPFTSEAYSNGASQPFTLGPTVHFTLTDRLGIVGDFLYKRVGYDSGEIVRTQPFDGNSSELVSANFERTRADYWDVPLMLRYYTSSVDESSKRIFFGGGVTLRSISGVKTFRETVVDFGGGLTDTSSIPVVPANSFAPGVVVGGGLQLIDEVGFKVDLEIRYTRWFRHTFSAGPVQADQNQGEVVLGLTF